MTMVNTGRKNSLSANVQRTNAMATHIASGWIAPTVLRLALAVPFWRSGVNKWDGFLQLNPTAIYLFSDEFKLHLPGGPYSYPAPGLMAFVSGSAEILLPILLVVGLFSRAAALALFGMTLVVQLTVPDGWPIHITWAAMALALIAWGPGRFSLDRVAGIERA
ncbi:DoxX family membrane protein [Mesorhizobium sp. NBSH29]|nr:DoxX family membrane protein [Mesorhizobium sp. NBSH29]